MNNTNPTKETPEDLVGDVRQILGLEAIKPVEVATPTLIQTPVPVVSPKLEAILADAQIYEIPTGEAFSKSIYQRKINGRSDSYKTLTTSKYDSAVNQVRNLYKSINNKENLKVESAKEIVNSFALILKSDRNILLNFSNMPVSHEDYLYAHAVNVCLLSLIIASAEGYTEAQTVEVSLAGLLQDVGMELVPEAIMVKNGSLNAHEIYEVHKHPIHSANILESMSGLSPATLLAIYQHHERMGGTGYPKMKSSTFVHPYARIIAIADTYSALVVDRPYRKKYRPYNAMEAVIKMGATGLFDTKLIRKFMECMSLFPLGSLVKLSSGRIGKVVHANPSDFTKPSIAILSDETGKPMETTTLVELKTSSEDKIVQALGHEDFQQTLMDGF